VERLAGAGVEYADPRLGAAALIDDLAGGARPPTEPTCLR
jgi:hypothetical protein